MYETEPEGVRQGRGFSRRSLRALTMLLTIVSSGLLFVVSPQAEASLPGENGALLISADEGPFEEAPLFVPHIYDLNLDGSFKRYAASGSVHYPSLSPSRSHLAFSRNPGDQLLLGKVGDIDSARQVTFDTAEERTSVGNPVFAPDGRSILYEISVGNNPDVSSWQLGRYWLRSGDHTVGEIVDGEGPNPDISPDGKTIAYSTGDVNPSRIWFSHAVSGKRRRFKATVPAWGPSYSPDGKRIAFLGFVDGYRQVFVSRVDGSHQTQLTFGDKWKSSVVFSPDGTKIAYQQQCCENSKIFVRDLATGNEREISYPGRNAVLSEWPRKRLFEVLGYHRKRLEVRVKVYGPGQIRVRSGGKRLAFRKVKKAGKFNVRIHPGSREIPKSGRVTFQPVGAIPGSLPFGDS